MTLLVWEKSAIVRWLAHSLVLLFLGIGMRINLFQSCGDCWVFQICLHTECNTLMASSFLVLNCSTEIPSHPLALLTAVLLKAHQTVTLQNAWLWVADHAVVAIWFIWIFCTVLPCILSISSWSLQHLLSLYHLCPLLCLGQNLPSISPIFLKRSLVFPLLLFSSSFIHWPLKMGFLSLSAVLGKSASSWIYLSFSPLLFVSFLSLTICKSSSHSQFALLLLFFFGMASFSVFCTTLQTSIHNSPGTLFTSSNPLNLFITSTAYS